MARLCSWGIIGGEMRSSFTSESRIAFSKEVRRVSSVPHSTGSPLLFSADQKEERRRLLYQPSRSSYLHSLRSQTRDTEVTKVGGACIGRNPFFLLPSGKEGRREGRCFSTERLSEETQQDRGAHSLSSSQGRYHSLLKQEDHHKEKEGEEHDDRDGRKAEEEEDQKRKSKTGGEENKRCRDGKGDKEEEKDNYGDARYSEKTPEPSTEKRVKGNETTCIYTRERGADRSSALLVARIENDECSLPSPSSSSCSPCLESPEKNSLPSIEEHTHAPSSFSPVNRRFSQKHRKGKFMLKGYKGLHSALKIRDFLSFENGGEQTNEGSRASVSRSSDPHDSPYSTRRETEKDKQGYRRESECMYTSAPFGDLPEETVDVREIESSVASNVDERDISIHSHARSKGKEEEQDVKENTFLSSHDVLQNQPLNPVGCTYTSRGGGRKILRRTDDQIFFDTLQHLSRSKDSSARTFDDFYRLPPLSLATKNMRRYPFQSPRSSSSSSFSERSVPCEWSTFPFPRSNEERQEEEGNMIFTEKREMESNLKDRSQDGVHPGISNLSLPKLRYLEELFFRKNEERLLERQRGKRREQVTLGDRGEEELQEEIIRKESLGNNFQEEERTEGVYGDLLEKQRREETSKEKKRNENEQKESYLKTEAVHASTKAGLEERKEEKERFENDDEEDKKKKMILEEELRSYLLYYTRVGIHHLELESLFRLFFKKYLHTFSLHELKELQTLIHFTPSFSSSSSSSPPSSSSFPHEERDTRNVESRDTSLREKTKEEKEKTDSTENSESLLPSSMTQQKDNRRKNNRKKNKHRSPDDLDQLGFLFSLLNGTAQELPSELKSNRTLKLFLTFLYEEHPLLSQFTDSALHSASTNASSSLSSDSSKIPKR
ncbi:hypothetical protein CSUI_001374 [Cystoisospora suis]|uniref:Uncharacterized protein n=1 Tax=Cystoisospora suis TaxID=483139 RepID=A0A2C6KL53_9APIC|nr:hypothetical protein CSUI_001374 [Cystoisospora suis]